MTNAMNMCFVFVFFLKFMNIFTELQIISITIIKHRAFLSTQTTRRYGYAITCTLFYTIKRYKRPQRTARRIVCRTNTFILYSSRVVFIKYYKYGDMVCSTFDIIRRSYFYDVSSDVLTRHPLNLTTSLVFYNHTWVMASGYDI